MNTEKEVAKNYFEEGLAKMKLGSYIELGRYKEALANFDNAILLNPDDADAYLNRGIAKSNLFKYKKAIVDFDKVVEFNPDYADAYFNRGVAKGKLGKHDEALADYTKAIALNPDYADAYNNRGEVKARLRQYIESIVDYDKVIEIGGIEVKSKAYNNRGIAEKKLGRRKEAKVDFTKAKLLSSEFSNSIEQQKQQERIENSIVEDKTVEKKEGATETADAYFWLFFFLGVIGLHKFYVGKIGLGLVYLLTGGIFGIGVFCDLIGIINGETSNGKGELIKFGAGYRIFAGVLLLPVILIFIFVLSILGLV